MSETSESASEQLLPTWVVYDRPTDFPEGFIARKWIITGGIPEPVITKDVVTDTTLSGIRRKLPPGLIRMERHPTDDEKIVETWF